MPVRKCSNGKWRIGDGECVYRTEAAANRAYRAYLAMDDDEDNHEDDHEDYHEDYHEDDHKDDHEDEPMSTKKPSAIAKAASTKPAKVVISPPTEKSRCITSIHKMRPSLLITAMRG